MSFTGTRNQERAAARMTSVVRMRGADGGVYIHGYAFCPRCQRETFHRAFDNAPFPICQAESHARNDAPHTCMYTTVSYCEACDPDW
jgi:hypothetical protein